jgi:uncharacterized protein YacL
MPTFSEIIEWITQPEVTRIIVAALVIYLILLWAALIAWATKDILSRTNNLVLQIFSILLVAVLNIFGLIIYLAIRPSKTLVEKFFEDLEFEALVQESKKTKKSKNVKKTRQKKSSKK